MRRVIAPVIVTGRERALRAVQDMSRQHRRREPDTTAHRQPPQAVEQRLSDGSWRWWLPAGLVLALYLLPLSGTLPAKNPNELSRIELALALADRRAIEIDAFTDVKGYGLPQDRSVRDGRNYSDKAPGLSFVAVPAAGVLTRLLPATDAGEFPPYWPVRHVLTGLFVALPAAWLPFWLLRRYTPLEPRLRAPCAVLLALTTPMLTYATVFFGHVPAAILTAVAFVVLLRPGRPDYVPSPRAAALSGLLAGYSVVTEYPTAITGAVLLVVLVARRTPWRTVLGFIAGGVVGVLPVLVYHHVAFGAPWTTGYAFKSDIKHAAVHAHGLMGIAFPTLERLWGVLGSAKRGVLFYCPLLLLTPVGLVRMAQRSRRDAWPLALLVGSYVFIAAGFVDWEGGWCAAARHLTVVLPLLVFPVAEAVAWLARRTGPGLVVVVLAGLATGGAVLSIVLTPFFPAVFTAPLAQLVIASFRDGAAFPNLLSSGLSVPPRVAAAILAVIVVGIVAVTLVRVRGTPHARYWVPPVLVLTVVLHSALLWKTAPPPTPQQTITRAAILKRLSYPDLAERILRTVTPAQKPNASPPPR